MTAPPPVPSADPPPAPTTAPIGEVHADDEREESASLRDPSRRLSLRTLVLITAALWLAALITLAVVLWLWHTPPLHPVRLS